MTSNRKWWILPPAVALLLVLGPLSMRGETAAAARGTVAPPNAPAAQGPSPTPATTAADRNTLPLPRTPDVWQIGSTLIGVLLLGGAAVMVLRRLRQGPAATGAGAIALRQTLRLSARQSVHAVEFDGRMLLVGEGERGLQLLHASTPPNALVDEALVTAAAERLASQRDDDRDDDGAVPKNLVLPRPGKQTARPQPAPRAEARRDTPRSPLGDFRALLAKVGR